MSCVIAGCLSQSRSVILALGANSIHRGSMTRPLYLEMQDHLFQPIVANSKHVERNSKGRAVVGAMFVSKMLLVGTA